MANDDKPQKKPLDLGADLPGGPGASDTFAELDRASKKGGLLGRVNAAFHDALQSGRGEEAGADIRHAPPRATAAALAIRRAKHTSPRKMVVPEGVVISGSMSSGSETEISGRIEGDVIVDGRLYLGPTALVTGSVRATSCRVEGLVEGKMECSQEIDLGPHGRLNADAMAGKKITVAGQVFGTITAGGLLHLVASGRIEGTVHARRLVVEEGASFNGGCTMRTPAQRKEA